MATRRTNASANDVPTSIAPSHPTPSRPATNSNTAPAVPAHIIYKLLTFSFLMFAAPISMYFLTVNSIFAGNSSYAGGFAALTANVVLAGYIVVAVMEDQGDQADEKKDK